VQCACNASESVGAGYLFHNFFLIPANPDTPDKKSIMARIDLIPSAWFDATDLLGYSYALRRFEFSLRARDKSG